MKIHYSFPPLPFGECLLAVAEGKICLLSITSAATRCAALDELTSRWPGAAIAENDRAVGRQIAGVKAYAAGDAVSPENFVVLGTPFQMKVWHALQKIPFGMTVSYRDVACAIGMPTAARAVANAIGANPVALLIPCHRVIRSDGALGGYRWGTDIKKKIIEWEKAQSTVKKR